VPSFGQNSAIVPTAPRRLSGLYLGLTFETVNALIPERTGFVPELTSCETTEK